MELLRRKFYYLYSLVFFCLMFLASICANAIAIDSLKLVPSEYNGSNISCNSASDGLIDLTVYDSLGSYTYLWSSGETTEDIAGLIAGSYSVTVYDINNDSLKASILLVEPSSLNSNCVLDSNITCNGNSDGGATVIASGGTTPYSYLWGDGQTNASAVNLSGGNYMVTVTDANGCSDTCSVMVSEPLVLSLTCSLDSNVTCNGNSDGGATVSASGGTLPYSYSWDDGQTNASAVNLSAGNHMVTVTDANGCIDTCSVDVTEPTALSIICSIDSNVTCNTFSDGGATVSASGGTAPYFYLWVDGQTNASAVNLSAGNHLVTVTDANGCSDTCSVMVSEPLVLSLTCSLDSNVTCNGDSDGGATVAALGGTSPYSYAWSDGQTNASAVNLSGGTYMVTVTDANGCSDTCSVMVSEPLVLSLTCSLDSNVTCNGNSDGGATVAVLGGTSPYSYAWSDGQTNASAVNLSGGTYMVTVTDANGCSDTCSVTITEPIALVIICSVDSNVTCNTFSDGVASVLASGGTLPYSYVWSDGQTNASAVNLSGGTYMVTVTDANGCSDTCSATITEPIALVIICSVDSNVTCNTFSDGGASVSASGGTLPYFYLWSDGQTNASAVNLSSGTYTVTVTDGNGCSDTCLVIITELTTLVVTCFVDSNVTCFGLSNGGANSTVVGGASPYSYLWSNGLSTGSATNLVAGTFTLTVTDSTGCIKSCSIVISQPDSLLLTCVADSNVSCIGLSDGVAKVLVSGGTSPYNYLWDNSSTFQSISNLIAGVYSVTVTDANGCSDTCSVTITEPIALSITCSVDSNVTCNGNSDGGATVAVLGGTSPYSYAWSNGHTNASAVNLSSGTYIVTVTDTNGCSDTCSVTITEPTALSIACSVDSIVICNGNSDGGASVSAIGGTSPYSYAWSDGQTNASAVNLSGGTYMVTVTDANGCSDTCSVMVSEPLVLSLTCSLDSNVTCNGNSDGGASVSAIGGTLPYSYAWSDGQTNASAVNLSGGTYMVTVTDANGCSDTCSVMVSEPLVLSLTCSLDSNVTCNGNSDGGATVAALGGTSPYSYAWSDGQTNASAVNLSGGTYMVTVTDANGCSDTCSVMVSEPLVLSLTCSLDSNVTCNGNSDGGATVAASGGTAPYFYLWVDGQTNASAVNLSGGTYMVTVTDANGCSDTCSVMVSEPLVLSLTCSLDSNVTCNGNSDGGATVAALGGTSPYSYAWSDGQTNASAVNLSSGTYMVTVTDANGCSDTCSVMVSEPLVLSLTCSLDSNVTCNGNSDGGASVSAIGGTLPYSYAWSDGQTNASAVNLSGGTYMVTVTDANGCSDTCSVMVSEPLVLSLTCSLDSNVTCNGNSDGGASVSAIGGTLPYSYAWSDGQTNASAVNLSGGNYMVTVTDANGCSDTCSVMVSEPLVLSLTCSLDSNVTCNGNSDGGASVSAIGGTLPYSYAWSDGQTNASAVNLSGGNYMVTVTDANGCSDTCSVMVSEPLVLSLTCSLDSNVTCNGNSDGGATVAVLGGTSPYSYAWSDGQTNASAVNLSSGTYMVTVTDANGCSDTCSVIIMEPIAINPICSIVQQPSCLGFNDGIVSVGISGGVGPVTILWSNGDTNFINSNLSAGTYTATVTDSTGCSESCSIVMTQPNVLSLTCTERKAVSCFGRNDGQAEVMVSGGTAPYTYLWNNGQTNSIAIILTAGNYQVTVTDVNGCFDTCSVTITQPPLLVPTCSVINDVSCNGGSDGSVSVVVVGGIAPYTYQWSDALSTTTAVASNLVAGTYTVTVRDSNNCADTCIVTISEPTQINLNCFVDSNVTCNGFFDGGGTVIASGGTPPYGYLWSNGATLSSATNLGAGTYIVTVTDSLGCFDTCSVIISQPLVLVVNCVIDQNVSCTGGDDGKITAAAIGGTAPYTYLWSNSQTSFSIDSLTIGIYTVTITDVNMCSSTCTSQITEPLDLSLNCLVDSNVNCIGGSNGGATVIVSGATGPYTYLWDNGQTTASSNLLSAGAHTVTVTDAKFCSDTCMVIITEPSALVLNCNADKNVSCFGLADGEASVSVTGGVTPYTYIWNSGSTGSSISGLVSGTYTVTVTDNNLCTSVCIVSITQPSILSLSVIDSIDAKCFGSMDGSISVNISGGTLPYNFLWSNSSTSQNVNNIGIGTYTLTVTDVNGCIDSISSSVGQPSLLVTTIDTTNGICGFPNGQAIAIPGGGTAPYTYLWSNGTTDSIANSLSQATYTVTVTDANSCTLTATAVVLNTGPVNLSLDSVSNVTCNGFSDGYLEVSGKDGVPPYTYLWSNASTDTSITALSAGNYTVTVTDNVGCTESMTYSVSEPNSISAIWTSTFPSCGLNNGILLVNGNGGSPPYSYLWSNGETLNVIDSLSPGSYTVTITDINGCVGSDSISITDQSGPIVSIGSVSNTSCNGGSDGSVSINVFSGTSPLSFLWSNAQSTQNISGISAGMYMVTVTDSNGCFDTLSVLVSQPSPLNIVTNTNSATCNLANGSAFATVSGGSGSYTYLWSNGSTTDSTGNVTAGAYVLTVTDVNLCTATAIAVVNNVGGPVVAIDSIVDVNCFGGIDGSIYISTAAGVPPYSFIWSNGATTEDLLNVSVNNYTLTVTDNIGCVTNIIATINQPTDINIFFNVANETCGNGNGSIVSGIFGGSPGYSYLWSTSATTASINSLSQGFYTLTITDANGCIKTASTPVFNIPGPIVLLDSIVDVDCNGDSTGKAYISLLGGTPPFNYNWSNGSTNQDLVGAPIGMYTVTVTDVNLCTATSQINIVQPSVLSLSINFNSSTCGNSNGGAIAVVGGGIPGYTYLWSNSTTNASMGGVVAGLYTVTVTDMNLCTITDTVTITNIPGPNLSIDSIIDVACFGDNTGSIFINVSGGTSPFTYLWSNAVTTKNNSSLISANYTVTVTDLNNCTKVINAFVNEPSQLGVSISTNSSTCSSNNGSASASVSGGVAPYTYLWSNSITSSSISSVVAGVYAVTVQDANGCTISSSATISDIPGPTICIDSIVNVDCFGGNTGLIDICLTNGTAPFSYLWSNSNTTELNTNLFAGTYTVTVQDFNACIATLSMVVSQPAILAVSLNSTSSTCGYNNGSITNTTTGGTVPYSFLWSNSETTANTSNLLAGSYTVTITDANGCTVSSSTVISDIPGPVLVVDSVIDVDCFSSATGSIYISHSLGTSPFTYLWSNGATTQDLINVITGAYSLIITDNNTCADTIFDVINQPLNLVLNTNTVNSTCMYSNGTASVSASGGTSPYTYLWSNASTNSSINALSVGFYTVSVTDANNCSKTTSVLINTTIPPQIVLDSIVDVSCLGFSDGSITVAITNGTGPIQYNWSNGNSTSSNNGLIAGVYMLTVFDSLMCSDTLEFTVTEPSLLTSSVSKTDAFCTDGNGSAIAIPAGGTAPYGYIWSNAGTDALNLNLAMGTYTVTVTDANNCTVTSSITIDFYNSPLVTLDSVLDVSCNGGTDGSIFIDVIDGAAPYSYVWTNTIQTTQDISGISSNNYTVIVLDTNNCSDTLTAIVNEPPVLSAVDSVSNANCGVANGSATIIVSGGTPGYDYLWSTGSTVDSISNVSAATYTVTVTDNNLCTSSFSVNINNDGAPVIGLDSLKNVSCASLSDGLINLNVSGGLPPYSFLWSSGATTQNLVNIPADNYTVTVTDNNGCVFASNFTVNEPSPLVASTVTVNATCLNPNGSAVVAVVGGTTPYNYIWSNGSTLNIATNLLGGPISVSITDSQNCKITVFDTIFDAGVPAINLISLSNNACFGDSSGIINVFAIGGSPSYTFNWSNGSTTEDISGLVADTYTLFVIDSLGCIDTAVYSISQPTQLMVSFNTTTSICDSSNGSISVIVSGGTPGYSYMWSTFDNDTIIDSLSTGTYTVTVTDANGCTVTLSATITDSGKPVLALDTLVNVNCFGFATGQIGLSTSGGTPMYSYTWSNANTTEDIFGLVANNYTVTVSDVNGCTSTADFTIVEPSELLVTLNSVAAICDSSNGEISSVVVGGLLPYSYLWSNASSNSSISGLSPGSYTLTVTDSNACVVQVSDVVLDLFSPQISVLNLSNVSCFNGSDGILDVDVIGPSQPFQYLWSTNDTIQDLIGIPQGIYTLTVTDTNNCISSFTDTITQSSSIGIDSVIVNATCGLSNGSISVSGFGGNAPYSYLWSTGSSIDSIGNINTGSYTVTVTDALGCDTSFVLSILNTGNPSISVASLINVKCFGGSDGSIDISISGGTPGYTYLWLPNNDTTQDISSLSVGTYNIIVTDSSGCVASAGYSISQPLGAISINFNLVNPSCNISSGSACANIIGGTPGYSYLWSNAATTACINNIAAGSYTVTITDANLCSQSAVANLSDLSGPQIVSVDSSNTSCPGVADGSISLVVSASNPPYTINWSNTSQTGDTITGLFPNTYIATITDSIGCITTRSIVVDGPESWNIVDSIPFLNDTFNVSCNGLKDASISLLINGGSVPYTYNWSNGSSNKNLSNIGAGTYTILITDAEGCDTTITYNITQPAPLFGNPMGNLNVCGVNSALLTADDPPIGAIGYWVSVDPQLQIVDSLSANTMVTNLQAGNNIFYWIVTDSVCYDSAQVVIILSSEVSALPGVDKIVCENLTSLTATPTQPGFGYWSNVSGTGIIDDSTMATTMVTNLAVGQNTFLWTVVNGNCRDSATVTITLDDPLNCLDPLEIPTGITPNGDLKNDYFVVRGIEGYPNNELLIFNRWGNLVFDQKNYDNSWNGESNSGDILPDGTYFVILRINNGDRTLNGYVDIRRR